MAKITREQAQKINAKCANDFRLDISYFVIWGEKHLKKEITIEGSDSKYSATLMFCDVWTNHEKVGVEPTLTIDRLDPTGNDNDFYLVTRLYKANVGDIIKRKSMKVLQEMTRSFDDNAVLDILRAKELCA